MPDHPSVVLLVNADRAEGEESEVLERLGALGIDVDFREVGAFDELPEAARRAVAEGASIVAVAGGDGSVRAAAGALAGTDAALAVVPSGSVNLLAATVGIESMEDAAEAIANGSTRHLDVAQLDDELWCLNATSGFDAEVIADTSRRSKERLGKLAFVLTAVTHLRDAPVPVRVSLDDEPWFDGRATSVLVLNVGERGGTDFSVIPGAEPDDGRLDVAVMRTRGVSGMVRLFWRLARGRRPSTADMVCAQGRRVTVEWARPVAVQIDGDGGDPRARLDIEVRHAVLGVRSLPATLDTTSTS